MSQTEHVTSTKIHRSILIEWITLLGAIFACFAILYSEIKDLDGKIERQGARTDRLYEMFIDLIKETRK